jgi:hypothetical protein
MLAFEGFVILKPFGKISAVAKIFCLADERYLVAYFPLFRLHIIPG